MNLTCSGPGPHIPADGILGQTDSAKPQNVRCSSPSCVIPADPEVVNRQTIEQAITDALAQLDALIAAAAVPTIATVPTIPAGAALTATQLTTSLRAVTAWANTAHTEQRAAAQATRAGAQQVAATLKKVIRLARGDFTGTD